MSTPRTRTAVFALLLAGSVCAQGQGPDYSEFKIQPNGLIYADSNMKMLSHMVDSLNVRFRHCDLARTYYSEPQGKLWVVDFASAKDNLNALRHDLDRGISLDSLMTRYKSALRSIDTDQLAVEFPSRHDSSVDYLIGSPSKGYELEYSLSRGHARLIPGKWAVRFDPKDRWDSLNQVRAYRIPRSFARKPIPDEYARYIQYVDCMIDTGTSLMLSHDEEPFGRNVSPIPEARALNTYLDDKMGLIRKKNKEAYDYMTREKMDFAISNLRQDTQFRQILQALVDSSIRRNTGGEALEELAAALLSKEKALELKRHRLVMGRCSMDQSPRIHAQQIALLAAETNSWNIFLRAHLDIMNDRFDRMSDGTYAYARRKTYIKELEALDLDIVDLMIGLSLRASGLSANHYYGTVWRLASAMTESRDQDAFQEKVMGMLQDGRLDDFNRGLLFLLWENYLNDLDDRLLANQKIRLLKDQAMSYPASLRSAIASMKERTQKTTTR